MNKVRRLLLVICILPLLLNAQTRPKIGLALSGGGAKGIAHIGLLKAIDSAGINIDYVAGTSMGAIVGGLYASGYSGNEIEAIAKSMDWSKLLTNKPFYNQLLLPQKTDYDKFVEVPMLNGKFHFGKGVLESNELWLFLNSQFFPYLTETDFTKLPRPFRCVATRLDNGEVVILKDGNLIHSIRASMAIPSVFTPVRINDNVLIDGGLVRNFPVTEALDMGADLVIGSSVAEGLMTSEDLDNPFQMLNQIAFYGEQRDYKEQVAASTIFVDYPLGKYNAGSFASADGILEMGIQKGKEVFPLLKRMKDSLDQIYGIEEFRKLKPKTREKVNIAKFTAEGLDYTEYTFLMKQLEFVENHEYSPAEITERIRLMFATGAFRKINYDIEDNADGTVNMHLSFQRDYRTYLKAGLGYNTETGLGIKLGANFYGLLGPFSTSTVGVSIGENPQLMAKNTYFFDRRRSWYLETSLSGELNEIGTYNVDLAKTGIYNQSHFKLEMNLNKLVSKDLSLGFGTRYEFLRYNPEIQTLPEAKGRINFLNSYFALHYNDLKTPYNPHFGNFIHFETGIHYNQNPNVSFNNGTEVQYSDRQKVKNYATLKYYSAHYIPVYKHTVFLKLNSGIHFGNKLPFMNDFLIGGNNFVARNQILFSGFRLNAISSSSVVTAQTGYRYNFSPRFSLSAASSVLAYDFVKTNFEYPSRPPKTAIGFDLTAGYRSFVGPIEVSIMYNSINDKIITTFNVGYSLNFSK